MGDSKFLVDHFRTDNEVALELGKKVAAKIIQKVKNDGADDERSLDKQRNAYSKSGNQ